MAKLKNIWWAKLSSFCCLVFFIMAIGIGFTGVQEGRTNSETNLSLSGQALYPQPVDQEVPEIYDTKVVWMQQGDDYYYKVFLSDLETGSSRQLGQSAAAEKYPAIWGNKVIWMDYRSIMDDPSVENKYAYIFKYYDMYGYDLETDEEFPICTNPEWQGYGDIQKERVVYADLRTGSPDIFLYDLRTSQEYAICLDPSWQGNPVISDNYIIWMDERSGNYDIYGLDLTTGREFPICTAADNQAYPAVSGTKVVWQDKRNGNDDIYLYDLATKQEIAICVHEGKQQVPDICGNIVVWQDDRNGNWDIYGYDLNTHKEFQITDQSGDQTFPAISGDRIIWVDSRSGHKNVYAAILPTGFAPQPDVQVRYREAVTAAGALTASVSSTIASNIDISKTAVTATPVGTSITGPSIVNYENSGCKKEISSTTGRSAEEEKFTCSYHDNLLYLFHENASYNCCIEEIAVTMSMTGNTINIYEEEKLEGSGCRCICTYDITTKIGCLEPGTYEVKFFNKKTGQLLGVIKEVVIPPIVCPISSTAPAQKCCPLPCTDPINRCCPYASAIPEQKCIVCPVPCPVAADTVPAQFCCPCRHFDNMELDTWKFTKGPVTKPFPVTQEIDYSTEAYVSPKRSIRAFLEGYLEKTSSSTATIKASSDTLIAANPLLVADATQIVVDPTIIAPIDPEKYPGKVSASREFYLCGCEDLNLKLSYRIQQVMTSRSAYRRVSVEVIARNASGQTMGQRSYVLFKNGSQSLEPNTTILIESSTQDKWNTLERSLEKDIPIKWCEVRTIQVILTAAGNFPPGSGDYLKVFWDDLTIWGQNCDSIPWCYPCPTTGTAPQIICCPLATADVSSDVLWCRPCPYAYKLPTGEVRYCCPVAATADIQLWCRPCPVADTGTAGPNAYCCPVAATTADSQALWCRPCPLATNVDDNIQAWCCPVSDATVEGVRLWCRPCPIAVQLDNSVIRWCCPVAQADVANQALWCRPCPYVVEKDGQLTRWCCPLAKEVDNQLWCRPCPNPKTTDKELNIYCCPIATSTGQDLWCKPCPLAAGVDEALRQWCCPLPTAEVNSDVLWCRPCPFVQNVDGGIINYCCPLATAEVSSDVLWCRPCPYEIKMADGTIKRCCPLATAEVSANVLRCYPCPIVAGTSPSLICKPCPYAYKLPTGEVRYCCPVAATADIQLWCRPCPVADTGTAGPNAYCCPVAATTADSQALWCRPCPLATNVDDNIQAWCCPVSDATVEGVRLWCRPCPIAVQLDNSVIRWCCPVAQADVANQALWCRPCPYVVEKDGQLTRWCCPLAKEVDNQLWCRPCPNPKTTDKELNIYCCPIATSTGQDLWCKPCPLAAGVDEALRQWCCPLPTAEVNSDVLWCRPCPFVQNVDGGIINYCCPLATAEVSSDVLWCRPCPYEIKMADGTIKRCCPLATAEVSANVLRCYPCPIVAGTSPALICKPCPVPVTPLPDNCIIAKVREIQHHVSTGRSDLKIVDESGNIREISVPLTQAEDIEAGDQVKVCFEMDASGRIISITIEKYDAQAQVIPPAQICYPCPLATAEVSADVLWCKPCPYAYKLPTGEVRYCCPVAATADIQLWCRPCPVADTGTAGPNAYCCPVATATVTNQALWCRPCPLATNVDNSIQVWCCPVPDVSVEGVRLWCRPCPIAAKLDNSVIRWCCPLAQADVADQALWCRPCPYVVEKDGLLTRWCCPIAKEVDNQLWCRPCPYPKTADKELNIYCCPIATSTGQDLWCKPCPLAAGVDETLRQWCCPLPAAEVSSDILWCRPCPFAQNVDGSIINYCCPLATAEVSSDVLWCRPCPASSTQPAQICCPISTAQAAGSVLWCHPLVTGCTEESSGALDIEGAQGIAGGEVKIPVRIQKAPTSVSALGFEVVYRPDILQYIGYEPGDLVTSFRLFQVNSIGTDRLIVGGASDKAIPKGTSGRLVWLKFKVIGDLEDGCYPLDLEKPIDDLVQFSKTGGCICLKDTVPPEIDCPADRVIAQITSAGTPADDPEIVAFLSEAKAWDAVDGKVEVTCHVPSGVNEEGIKSALPQILPPGKTTVIFTASDKAGNTISCTATITIQPIVCEEDDSGKLDIEGTQGRVDEEVKIPVRIQKAPGAVSSLGFEVSYKPSVLEYLGFEPGNLVTSFPSFSVNSIGSGRLIAGGYSTQGIPKEASGTVVILKFKVRGGMEGGCYPLRLEELTDDLAKFSATPGCFCIYSCDGDLNGDGSITPKDALIAFQCYLAAGPCSDCADVDGNGSVTPADALCLFKKYLGQPSCLDNQ
ncbi:MAG: cohesin domain-containing protein [bacterium]